MKSQMLVAMIILSLGMSTSSNIQASEVEASPRPNIKCSDLIHACDKALADKDAQIGIRDNRIEFDEKMIQEQSKRIESQDAWYKSPFLWLFIGGATGAYLMRK